MRRPAVFDRALTPLEIGGLLAGLTLILAACCGCLGWAWLLPGPAPQVPDPVATISIERR